MKKNELCQLINSLIEFNLELQEQLINCIELFNISENEKIRLKYRIEEDHESGMGFSGCLQPIKSMIEHIRADTERYAKAESSTTE